MSASYQLARTVTVSGFGADPDPRTTGPTGLQVVAMRDRVGDNALNIPRGHSGFIRALNSSGVEVLTTTLTFTVWLRDASSGQWVNLYTKTAQVDGAEFTGSAVGDLFCQVTAIPTPATAATIQIWIAERADTYSG